MNWKAKVVADLGAMAAAVGSMFHYLPYLAAAASLLYTTLSMLDNPRVQRFLQRFRRKNG